MNEKKTYYCVTSAFHSNGRVTANITMVLEADEKPKNTFRYLHDRDIYSDWFDTKADADKAVAEARAENTETD